MNQIKTLPKQLRGRDIFTKVIPTVNTLTNLFKSLDEHEWDEKALKNWENPIFKAYKLENIKAKLKSATNLERKSLVRNHILELDGNQLGAHPLCVYLIAFYKSNYPADQYTFDQFIKESGISDKEGSANAIWSVGSQDGRYLGIFNDMNEIIDQEFISSWTGIKTDKLKRTHLTHFLELPWDSKKFTGPNTMSWCKYVLEESANLPNSFNTNFYRDDLLSYCNDRNNSDFHTLLAVLSWGGMNRRNGKRLLAKPEPILDIIGKLRNGEFKNRRDAFLYIQSKRKEGSLPGLGIGYFTKLICFLAPNLNGYIMDQWVAKSINLITENSFIKINKSSWVTDENDAHVYEKFCSEIDKIGLELNVDGFKAEEKLFSIGGREKWAWRKYVIEKYIV